jgi:hypothetical protein
MSLNLELWRNSHSSQFAAGGWTNSLQWETPTHIVHLRMHDRMSVGEGQRRVSDEAWLRAALE